MTTSARKSIVFRHVEGYHGPPRRSGLKSIREPRLDTIFERYAVQFPRLQALASSIVLASNQQFCARSEVVRENDEIAFLPPVSGGTAATASRFSMRAGPLLRAGRGSLSIQQASLTIVARGGRSAGEFRRSGSEQYQRPPHRISGLRMLLTNGGEDDGGDSGASWPRPTPSAGSRWSIGWGECR